MIKPLQSTSNFIGSALLFGVGFLFIALLAFNGCQEPGEEVSFDEEEMIRAHSPLSDLISFATLKDGSYDNILDNASNISVRMPVRVKANQQELLISKISDFSIIQGIYREERYLPDSIEFIYPIKVINPNYSEYTVRNKEELEIIKAQSVEGGEDNDIECKRFVFPVKVTTYDTQNQQAYARTLQEDRDLFQLVSQLPEQHIFSFTYPIHLRTSTGEVIEIEGNNQLLSELGSSQSICYEYDEEFYKKEDFNFETGRLNIQLTDAPFPTDQVQEANVRITELHIKLAGEEDSLLILSDEPVTLNLLNLTNGVTATLVGMQVPEGTYDQLRMIISESNILLTDGSSFDLNIPGGAESGLKILLPSPMIIASGHTESLLLDFDVSRSFVVQGNPYTPAGIKGFIFKPVIKAVNLAEAGSLTGQVIDESTQQPLEGVQITVFASNTINTSTFTDENGNYKILGIEPGIYDISVEFNDYSAVTEENIMIETGSETELNIELTPDI